MHKTDQFLSTDMAAARFGAHYYCCYAMTCYAYTVKPRHRGAYGHDPY